MNPASQFNTATTLLPPPRRIRRRPLGRPGAIFISLFLLGFAVVGIYSTGKDVLGSLVASQGTPMSALIQNKHAEPHAGRYSTYYTYWVDFNYTFAGQLRVGRQNITGDAYRDVTTDQPVPGKAMQLGPWTIGVVALQRDHVGLVMGLVELVIFGALASILGGIAARKRRLVRLGIPAPGQVIGRRIANVKNVRYYLSYRFTTGDGTQLEQEMLTRKRYYEQLPEGTAVTVLYDPANPKRSMAYDGGDYDVVPAFR